MSNTNGIRSRHHLLFLDFTKLVMGEIRPRRPEQSVSSNGPGEASDVASGAVRAERVRFGWPLVVILWTHSSH